MTPCGDVYESCANVEPVDVIEESRANSINCSTCDATLEPEVWHILDTFENMFSRRTDRTLNPPLATAGGGFSFGLPSGYSSVRRRAPSSTEFSTASKLESG